MLKIGAFSGEAPRTHPRLLPDTAAQTARNTRLENGALVPVRQSRLDALATASTQTIYRHLGSWLTWDSVVNAVPGPVASERLYYTGDGVPKMRVDGTVYPLALPRPSGHLYTELVTDDERLVIDASEVSITSGKKGKTKHGWRYVVTKGDKATTAVVTCTHTGANISTTRLLLNTLRYRNMSASPANGVRTLSLTSVTNADAETTFSGVDSFIDVGNTEEAPDHTDPTDSAGASVKVTVGTGLGSNAYARIYFQAPYAGSKITSIIANGTTIVSTDRTIYNNTDIRTYAAAIVEEINGGSHGYTAKSEYTSAFSGYEQVVITVYASGATAANGDAFDVNGTGKDGDPLVHAGGQINWMSTFNGGTSVAKLTSIEIDGVELLTSDISYTSPAGVASSAAAQINANTTTPNYTAIAYEDTFTIYSDDPATEAVGRSVVIDSGIAVTYADELGESAFMAISANPLDPVVTSTAPALLFDTVIVTSLTRITSVVFTITDLKRAAIDSENFQSLIWAYTWVTEFDEESEPSDLSVARPWSSGNRVGLTNWDTPPSGRGVDRVRVYRSQTSALGETNLYFVVELTLAELGTLWIDDPEENDLQEVCPSIDYNNPPDGLTGLVSLPNGMMAAFNGKDLYFSEPWIPHAWPEKYVLTTESDIVALGAFGSSVAVLTTGTPYVAQGTAPDSMSMERLEVDLPCVSARGVVDLGYTIAYPSTDGLVSLSSSGAQVVSGALFTREQWQNMAPTAFRACRYSGRYVLSYVESTSRKTLFIDMGGQTPFVIRSDSAMYAMYMDAATGRLFYLDSYSGDIVVSVTDATLYASEGSVPAAVAPGGGEGGSAYGIYEFDCLANPRRTQTWKSKPFVLPAHTNFGALLIEAEPGAGETASVKVYADGVLKATVTKLNEPARLPSGFLSRQWELEISGNAPVTAVSLAGAPHEFAEG